MITAIPLPLLHPARSNMKYGNKKLFLPIVLLGLATFLFLHTKSFAQNSGYDVTVSPVFFDLSANPGSTVADKIRIRNNTNSPIPIKLTVEKITGDLNGNLTLKPNANDSSLSWVKFQSDKVTLTPLDWTDVPFTIEIPNDAAYGYYYAITFTQDNSSPLARNGAVVTGAAAVPILLDVIKEGAKADAKILQFSTGSYINEYLPVDFTVKVENIGNIHIKPHGNIFISGGGNKDLAVLDVNDTLGNIIPDSARVFTASWADGFIVREPVVEDGQVKKDKNGNPEEKLTFNWDKLTSLRIGKYDANLLMVFDNGKRDVPLEASVSFWVFPYKIIGGLILGLIALVFLIRFGLKRYINRELKKRASS